jgi:hypothetical protein
MSGVIRRAALVAAVGLAACVLPATSAADGGTVRLRVMTLNIFYGGDELATFSASSATGDGTWPLRPGLYEVRLLLDDGYKSVAKSSRFRIVPR